MTNCQDLCTAAKCQELEERIEQLELDLELLRQIVDGHILQPIPLAHDYDPPVPSVLFDIFYTDDGTYIFKCTVDGNSDTDTLILPDPNVALDIFETGEDAYTIKVGVDGQFDQDNLIITHPDIPEPEEPEPPDNSNSSLSVSGSYSNEILRISVSHDGASDFALITIPQGGDTNIVTNINIENQINNLTNIVQDCCNNISNDLSAVLNFLSVILNEVTVNVSGQSYDLDCVFEEYDQQTGSPLLVPKASTNIQSLQGNGLQGIAILINDLIGKIQRIEEQVCLNQNPAFNFTTELPSSCDTALQNQTIEEYLQTNPNLSWLQYLVDDLRGQNVQGNNLKINNNYHVYMVYMLQLIHEQQKQIINPVCELEAQDTVAIVASDRVINRVKDKQLILHFVTLDNYPKRQANSSYRAIQIPSPIDTSQLDWMTHFEPLRWHQGNLYAELELQDSNGNKINPPVSGFFEDTGAANSYFDAVLGLTVLNELNRKYHPNVNPPRIIPVQETRPYRAFVCFINASGQAEIETKFQPIN